MARPVTYCFRFLFALLMLSGATIDGFDAQAEFEHTAEPTLSADVVDDQTPHRRDRDEVSAAVDTGANLAECGKATPNLAPTISFGTAALAAIRRFGFHSSPEFSPLTLQHCHTRLQV